VQLKLSISFINFSSGNGSSATKKLHLQLLSSAGSDARPRSEHLYEQPMVVFPPAAAPHTADSSLQRTPSTTTTVQRPPSTLPLPRSVDLHSLGWAAVTPQGARIAVPRTYVSLTLPAGAVDSDCAVFVSQPDQERYRPQLDSSQTAVAPVVVCGPEEVSAR
jgi:hypothetical protein